MGLGGVDYFFQALMPALPHKLAHFLVESKRIFDHESIF